MHVHVVDAKMKVAGENDEKKLADDGSGDIGVSV